MDDDKSSPQELEEGLHNKDIPDPKVKTVSVLKYYCVDYKVTLAALRLSVFELDGVGPVGNRPSTDKLHQIVKKKKKKNCDM